MVYDPEPERYYDWMLWKLRQDSTFEKRWKENIKYCKSRRKEERAKRMKTQEDILKMDMAELTKSYYDVLKRNKELVEENERLKSQVGDWKNSLWGSHYRQRFHT